MSAEADLRANKAPKTRARGKSLTATIAMGISLAFVAAEWLGEHGSYIWIPSLMVMVFRLPGILLAMLLADLIPGLRRFVTMANHAPPSGPLVWVSMAMCNILLCEGVRLFWNAGRKEPKKAESAESR